MTNVPQYAPARPGHPSGFSGGPAAIPAHRAKGGFLLDVLVFVIPCLLFVEVTIIGRLFTPILRPPDGRVPQFATDERVERL